MKFKYRINLFLTLLITSCNSDGKYVPAGLKKLTKNEQIEIAEKRQTFNYENVVFKNESGATISADSFNKIALDENFASDVYFNKNKEPEIVVIRKATQEDKNFRKKIMALYQKRVVEPVVPIDIDCNHIEKILTQVLSLDQDMRMSGKGIDPNIDRQNLVTVVSLIKKCGMPTLNEVNQEQMSAIWLVFQHADNYHRKKYLPLLKKSAQNGDIGKSQIALMEDRILMMDGEPQIYGSQITKDQETNKWKIYDLKDPERVDKRRREVGLGPLKEYVLNWDIEFNIEQKK